MLSGGAVRPCLTQGASCIFHKVSLGMAVHDGNNCFILPLRWKKNKKSQQATVSDKKTENMRGCLEKPLVSPMFLLKVNLSLKAKTDF